MNRSAKLFSLVVTILGIGCVGNSAPKQDTGMNNGIGNDELPEAEEVDDNEDESEPAEDSGLDEPAAPCRNLSVTPPGLLLDSSDGYTTTQTVTLINTCSDEADPLTVSTVILADETGAFSLSASPPYVLESGATATIEVAFEPIDHETRTAFAIVVSDDPDTPNTSIGMVGRPPSDQDGDGYITVAVGGEDCDDTDPTAYPGAPESWYDGIDSNCDGLSDFDADGDGYLSTKAIEGNDCDDTNPDIHPDLEDTWYDGIDTDCAGNDDYDQDGDGFASAEFGGEDCNDLDPSFSPAMAEVWYDGVDSDCDGLSDFDADRDGHDHPDWMGDDCDDTDASISPTSSEVADDSIDQDCNGIIDDGTTTSDDDGDGFSEADGDCNDADPDIHPDAIEICGDGIDNECDGIPDGPGSDDCVDWYIDGDGDGYGAGEPACMCGFNEEYTTQDGGDCNDLDATIAPGQPDTWYDGIDSNCDGLSDFDADGDGHNHDSWGGSDCDDADASISPDAEEVHYDGVDANCDGLSDFDADNDGHIHIDHGGDDCNDDDALTSPTAIDEMDLIDQDCDGLVDEDLIEVGDVLVSEVLATPDKVADWNGEYFEVQNTTENPIDLIGWMITDADGESFTIDTHLVLPAEGHLVFGVNGDATTNGGVPVHFVYDESEFGLHYSSDRILLKLEGVTIGSIDYSSSWGLLAGKALSLDADFADPEYTELSQVWCSATSMLPSGDQGTPGAANDPCMEMDWDEDGYTELMGDCDDFDAMASPIVAEACDGIDNDCNGYIDEGSPVGAETFYADNDGDGYGSPTSSLVSCVAPENFVEVGTDCNDTNPDIHPGMEETWYDGIDSNCDDWSDFDADFDAYDSDEYEGEDCDDADETINPLALDEWYDGIDADCGGENDYDADLDGYASDEYGGLDCADYEPSINPATAEEWNAMDDNCLAGIDDFMVMGFSTLVIAADVEDTQLGYQSGLSTGDMDGDGVVDLVVAAEMGGYDQEGSAWIFSGANPVALMGTPAAVSHAQFSGAAAENYMGTLGAFQQNHIGSPVADLLMTGTDELGGYAMCLLNGDLLEGPIGCSDSEARWTGSDGAHARIINHLDTDGDGLPEIIYGDPLNGVGSTGMVYAFKGSSIRGGDFDLAADKDWRIDGRHAYDYVGSQLGGGDINDDGYDDLMVGAYGDDHPDAKTGSIFVFLGSADDPATIRTAQFDKDIHLFGNELDAVVGSKNPAEVGDINGDGASDIVLSSPGTETVHVFFTAAGLDGGSHNANTADVNIAGTAEAAYFGTSIALGDLDDDGFDDLIVGAPDEESPASTEADTSGHAYLFFGSEFGDEDLTASDAGAHFYGRTVGDNFGALIRSGFDMNGDGREDLAIAAPGNTPNTPNAGQVHIMLMPSGR